MASEAAGIRDAAVTSSGRRGWLRFLPALTLALLIGPVAAGLIGTALPAFGYMPALGRDEVTLAPWRTLFATPGLGEMVRLSVVTGIATTVISLGVVILFAAAWHGTPLFARLQRLLSPLLSVPHVTVAFGLAFLLTPSGWLVRLVSPWATGFDRPPDLIVVQDPAGLALIAGLAIKEIPYLFLMTLAALGQSDAVRVRTLARTLGYGPVTAWMKAVFPRLYPQIRLPIYAVLVYGVSVVDVAMVLGPTTPPPLAVQLVRWFNDPELALRFVASAGALLQLGLCAAAILVWWLAERAAICIGRWWIRAGWRGRHDRALRLASAGGLVAAFGAALAGLAGMAVWSVTGRWRFPDALPSRLSLDSWARNADALAIAGWHTVAAGVLAASIAALLAVACLENETRLDRKGGGTVATRALWLLYLPLLVPQIAFLFGTQVLLIVMRLDGTWLAIIWAHLVFVLPYVFLSLADPWRSWDPRYARSAQCLGASPWRVFCAVKLPMLLRPLLVALAIGFAISVGQYLPTLFAGGGRFATLTTDAVSLAASGNRRVIGVYALLQMALPFLAFALAAAVPAILFRRRRGLSVTA